MCVVKVRMCFKFILMIAIQHFLLFIVHSSQYLDSNSK